MFDYYSYVNELAEEKLTDEIEKIQKRMMKLSPGSPIFNQLMNMLDMAQSAYEDRIYARRIKKEDAVLDIGEIESTESKPDYDQDDILTALVHEYTKDFKR